MNDNNVNNNDNFVTQVSLRARDKVNEYNQLLHEQRRTEMRLERLKTYIEQLNNFLEAEGHSPVLLRELRPGSPVGKPGNRSKDFPVRKTQWEGMTLDETVQAILSNSPNEIYHADVIAHQIYEIQSKIDLRKVKSSLVSTLRRGAKKEMWESLPRNKYKAKTIVAQERLIHA